MMQFGFTFLPIWGVGGSYTLSGNYRLPVFGMGPAPKDDEVDEFGLPVDTYAWGPTTTLLDNVALGVLPADPLGARLLRPGCADHEAANTVSGRALSSLLHNAEELLPNTDGMVTLSAEG